MPNQRSSRKVKKFLCPFCQSRLWRNGSSKHYIFYDNAADIQKNTGISAKKAKLLHKQNTTYLDTHKWIESFYCSEHGQLWLLISLESQDYQYGLAQPNDWLHTNKTIDPTNPNPSVSEFSLKMSRKLC